MHETIGVKGGNSDRKKSLKITKENKEKLENYLFLAKEEELKALEKKVKQQQLITFLKIFPIITIGQVVTNLTENKEQKEILNLKKVRDHIEKSALFHEQETEIIVEAIDKRIGLLEFSKNEQKKSTMSSTNTKESTLEIELSKDKAIEIISGPEIEVNILKSITPIQANEPKFTIKEQISFESNLEITEEQRENKEEKPQVRKEQKEESIKDTAEETKQIPNFKRGLSSAYQVELTEINQDFIPLKESTLEKVTTEKFEQLKNHKLVAEYEKKLKDVRKDLRNLIFEYNVLVDETANTYSSMDSANLLEKLTTIIKKIEELKKKIDIPDIDKYDDNYLYTLTAEYIEEFKNRQFVDDIKDSALYISISEKLAELEEKKDTLSTRIEERKEDLEVTKENFEKLKNKCFDYEKFATSLLEFQNEQDSILKDINNKLANAETVEEKVQVKVQGITKQNKKFLALLGAQMMLPGARSAKGFATSVLTSLYFMKNIMRPKTGLRRYKVIKVKDYSKDIESSLRSLDDIIELLKQTSRQIDIVIKEFERDYQDYFETVPECKKILANLETVKDNIAEKEYELDRIKQEQEKNLENNNAKVKQLENNQY